MQKNAVTYKLLENPSKKPRYCKWQLPSRDWWYKFKFSFFLLCLILPGCSKKLSKRPFFQREKSSYTSGVVQKPAADQPRAQRAKHKPPAKSNLNNNLKVTAESYLGVPYRDGGQSRKGIDCSGFIQLVFQNVYNLKLPRQSKQLAGEGRGVKQSQLKKGDIVLFGSIFGIHHAGIYMEGRKFIHASTSRGVIYSSLDEKYYSEKYKGARRVIF